MSQLWAARERETMNQRERNDKSNIQHLIYSPLTWSPSANHYKKMKAVSPFLMQER